MRPPPLVVVNSWLVILAYCQAKFNCHHKIDTDIIFVLFWSQNNTK